jgi:spermidine/putrescine transport system substrate-binding protein
MLKIRVILVLALLCSVGILVAQDDFVPPTADDIIWTCPEGFAGQTLNVFNWSTYIGETTVEDFERLCGVTVNYDTFEGNEAMVARLRQGNPGFDVTFANEYIIPTMIREELVLPINLDNIPNIANIAERWRGLSFDPENEYSVPYLWGTTGIAYNVEKVSEPITSWEQIYNYNGPVAWLNDGRSSLSVALKLLGFEPTSQNPDEIAQARDFLLQRSSNVVAIHDDDGQLMLERGEVDIVVEYSGDIYQLISTCECDTYTYVIPDEGGVADIASMLIPTGAQNPALAEVFMDYILDPAVGAMIVNFTTYATPNQAAIDSGFIDPAILTNPATAPSDEALANMWFLEDVADAEQAYNDAWDEILILAGS